MAAQLTAGQRRCARPDPLVCSSFAVGCACRSKGYGHYDNTSTPGLELPGYIAFGDSKALHYFIARTWTAWLIMFTALWSGSSQSTAKLSQSSVWPC
jgi:hypothetical protein